MKNRLNVLVELIKLGRPRTWIFIILSYYIGWFLSSGNNIFYELFGLSAFICVVASTNIINAYTDIEEDKINLPNRFKTVMKIGRKNVLKAALILYICGFILAVPLPLQFLLIYLLAVFDSAFYSLPPLRFKTKPLMSLISFSGAVFLPLLAAWSINKNIFEFPVIGMAIGYWFLTYGTVKNLPDFEGDLLAGLKTTATVFKTLDRAKMATSIILLSPYPLFVMLISSGLIEVKFAILLVMLLPLLLVINNIMKYKSFDLLEKTHTEGFLYANAFLMLTLILTATNVKSVFIILVSVFILFLIKKRKFDSR
ncbi:hypothetical protein DRN74_04480 [Candidatus Micrarchaeota archaeon]|nr:MAG: hypothetical protein DRN74_04480 [Candidatus Micrarchaeota archaeon]